MVETGEFETGEFINEDAINQHKEEVERKWKEEYTELLVALKLHAARIHHLYHSGSRFRLFVGPDWTQCKLSTCREFQRMSHLSPFD